MSSGVHRHCKRLAASKSWGLDKNGGTFAVRMLPGAHNRKMCIPLKYILTRLLKIATSGKELWYILSNEMVLVNGKVATVRKAPVGLFDVVSLVKTNEHYRVLFNTKKKFTVKKITADEAKFRLTKVMKKDVDSEKVPYVRTLDGFNFPYVSLDISVNDTVKVDLGTNKIVESIKFEVDKIGFVFNGRNKGRIGVITRMETKSDNKVYVHLTDANNKEFTALDFTIMVIGDSSSIRISLDEGAGIKLDKHELSNLKYAVLENEEIAIE